MGVPGSQRLKQGRDGIGTLPGAEIDQLGPGGGVAPCRFRSSMFVLFVALAFNCLVQFAAGGVGWGLPGPAFWAAVFGCSAHVCSRPVCQRVGGCARGGRIDGDVRPVTHRYFPLFLPMPRSCEL